MKIDPTSVRDLFERMREAARVETSAGGAIAETGSADALSATGEPQGLAGQVRITAERALRGEFADPAEARAEVIEQILRHRWEDSVEPARLEEMVAELKPTLSSDPEFRRQVDDMLILAAREVGS